MKVVYYEDCVTNEITRCDRLPDGWSESQVKDDLKKYNANENKTCNAVMTEIEDGSLAAFLFEKTERRIPLTMKHGDWKFGHCGYFVCSNCGFAYDMECENYLMSFPDGVKELKFCPYCGARMDGDEK